MSWDVVRPEDSSESKDDISEEVSEIDKGSTTREKLVEHLINEFAHELRAAHTQKYETFKADLTAALCLDAQKELAEFLSEAELLAKEKKSEVESIEAEQYFHYKLSSETKTTDVALNRLVAKDEKVKEAKRAQYEAEAAYNKWRNLFGTLKDAHVYFRNLGRGKNEF